MLFITESGQKNRSHFKCFKCRAFTTDNNIGNRRAEKLNGETLTLTVAGNSYYA